MPFSEHVFRAYDVRGVYPNDIDAELFMEIGRAVDAKKVSVGSDVRESSPALLEGLIAGMLETGKEVLSTGTSSFGVSLFAGWKTGVDIMGYVTASHKPREWNGYKMYYGNGMPYEDIPGLNRKLGAKPTVTGTLAEEQWEGKYTDFMQDSFEIERISIAVDCGGGAMTMIAPELFTRLELNPELIYCEPDPTCSCRSPDPTPEACGKLIEASKRKDFGVAFDGDGDRAKIVDEKGQFLPVATIAYILAQHLPEGPIVATVADSRLIDRLGRKVIRIPVGHTHMIRATNEHKAALGMEWSFHITMPQYLPYDDGMVVPLKIAEILTKTGKTLSELASEAPVLPMETAGVEVADDKKFAVIETLVKQAQHDFDRVNTLDGVRVDFDHGWVLVRASNTGPKIRITAEAETEEQARKLVKDFKYKVESQL